MASAGAKQMKIFLLSLLYVMICKCYPTQYDSSYQTITFPSIFVYPNSTFVNKQLKFYVQYEVTVPNVCIKLFDENSQNVFILNQNRQNFRAQEFLHNVNNTKPKVFTSIICNDQFTDIISVKFYAFLSNSQISRQFTTATGWGANRTLMFVPIVTTKACKAQFSLSYFMYVPRVSANFTIYDSSLNLVQTITPGVTQFDINLNSPGKWYVAINHSRTTQDAIFAAKSPGTLYTSTNPNDSPCSNRCFLKGSEISLIPASKFNICYCTNTFSYKQCENNLKQCGNNRVEDSEQCDNGNTTGCSTDCVPDDGYNCTGSPSICTSSSSNSSNSSNTSWCGDGIKDATQQCDNGNKTGCINCTILPGFTCITSLCFQVCGDGVLTSTEQCDTGKGPGCSDCKIVRGFSCNGPLGSKSICSIQCGDGVLGVNEKCDNGNKTGCSNGCVPDVGFYCKNKLGALSVCTPVCGDGIRTSTEACDNGKKLGCSKCSAFDDGYTCTGEVGKVSTCRGTCGDSIRIASEICDNGNQAGCSKGCRPDIGYTCTGALGSISTCTSTCGDSIKAGDQACDNGNKAGCVDCTIDPKYNCKLASNGRTTSCRLI